jgi:hypothetical protein
MVSTADTVLESPKLLDAFKPFGVQDMDMPFTAERSGGPSTRSNRLDGWQSPCCDGRRSREG